MSYQITKGWPYTGALDIVAKATDAGVVPGVVATLSSAGEYRLGKNGNSVAAFIIDSDEINPYGANKNALGLMGKFIAEVDATSYNSNQTGSFTRGAHLGANRLGQFCLATSTFTGTTTAGSDQVTGLNAAALAIVAVGNTLSGKGIITATATTILAIDVAAGSLTLSQALDDPQALAGTGTLTSVAPVLGNILDYTSPILRVLWTA